jgi:hypothetical protein
MGKERIATSGKALDWLGIERRRGGFPHPALQPVLRSYRHSIARRGPAFSKGAHRQAIDAVACGPHQFLGNESSDLPLGSNVYEKSGKIGAWFPNRQPKRTKAI